MIASPTTLEPGPRAEAGGAAPVSPVLRFLPGITDIVFLLPFIVVLRSKEGISYLLGDSDTGWHLRTGEWILAHARVPTADFFSYTRPGQPWFAWEWLWDLCFGWLHAKGGLAAVVMVSLLVIGVAFVLVLYTAKRRCGNALVAFGAVWLGAYVSTVHWHARPHLVTFLFAALFGLILERVREGKRAWLWWLPPLTVLWTNLHGAFFVGLICLGAYAAGGLCTWLTEEDPRRTARLGRSVLPYVLAGAGCLLGSLVNPYGYRLHVHIYEYLFKENHAQTINEFRSLSFHHPTGLFFGLLLALGVGAALWHLLHRDFISPILILGWGWMALYSARNIPIFAIVAIPPVAAAAQQMLAGLRCAELRGWVRRAAGSFLELSGEVTEMERHWRLHIAGILPVALMAAASMAARPPAALKAQFLAERFPAAAVDRFLAGCSSPSARVFTHDQWGGYLIYRLYPRLLVFVDGRSDFYGPKFGEDWLRIVDDAWDWQKQLDRFGVNTVLVRADEALASTMKETPRWRVVYDDGKAIIFQPANQAICGAVGHPVAEGGGHGSPAAAAGTMPQPASGRERSSPRRELSPNSGEEQVPASAAGRLRVPRPDLRTPPGEYKASVGICTIPTAYAPIWPYNHFDSLGPGGRILKLARRPGGFPSISVESGEAGWFQGVADFRHGGGPGRGPDCGSRPGARWRGSQMLISRRVLTVEDPGAERRA